MSAPFDPYAVLGVPRDAHPAAIRRAYIALAKVRHPDAGGDPESFAELGRAWAILSDPVARRRYDRGKDVDGPAMSVRAQATQLVAQVVNDILTQAGKPGAVIREGFALCLQGNLKKILAAAEHQVEDVDRQIAVAQQAKDALGRKTGDRLLKSIIDTRLRDLRDAKTKFGAHAAVVRMALRLTESASSKVEPRAEPPTRQSWDFPLVMQRGFPSSTTTGGW